MSKKRDPEQLLYEATRNATQRPLLDRLEKMEITNRELRERIEELEKDYDEHQHLSREVVIDLKKRIAELESERDDYKDRWEQTGCTRHGAMEAAIKVNKELLQRIAELEADRDRWKQRHELNMKVENLRIAELEARLDAVNGIKYETHPSWGASEEFNDGWKACRELIAEVQEQIDEK